MQVPFMDLKAEYAGLKDEIDAAMAGVIANTSFILGPDVAQFEQDFAAFCEVDHAVGVDCGLSALELLLRVYGIGKGDEVITVANTFIATVFAISGAGATPVLVDCAPQTYNIDVNLIEAAITPKTKAIMPVHLYGQIVDMDPIIEIAEKHGLIVIEDACQSHGARYKGKRAGSMGHAAAFSFYPAKNLGGYGDGGALVTKDAAIAEQVKKLRNYGQREKYYHELRGANNRLDSLQAAILRTKLPYLDERNSARRSHAEAYGRQLAGAANIVLPVVADFAEPIWHLYVVRVKNRAEVQQQLKERGIQSGIHYPVPIHMQAAYQDLGYKQGDFPVTEMYADEILSLPMYPELSEEAIAFTAESLKEICG